MTDTLVKLYAAGVMAAITTLPWGKQLHPIKALVSTVFWPITLGFYLSGHRRRVLEWLS